jgi:hypothetical protein
MFVRRPVATYIFGQTFGKSRNHLRILGARRVTWSKFRRKDPQILSTTVKNLVAVATGRPGLVQPSVILDSYGVVLKHRGPAHCLKPYGFLSRIYSWYFIDSNNQFYCHKFYESENYQQ